MRAESIFFLYEKSLPRLPTRTADLFTIDKISLRVDRSLANPLFVTDSSYFLSFLSHSLLIAVDSLSIQK